MVDSLCQNSRDGGRRGQAPEATGRQGLEYPRGSGRGRCPSEHRLEDRARWQGNRQDPQEARRRFRGAGLRAAEVAMAVTPETETIYPYDRMKLLLEKLNKGC